MDPSPHTTANTVRPPAHLAYIGQRESRVNQPPRMLRRPLAFGPSATSRRANYQVAASDLNSALQMVADALFIVALGGGVGIAYHYATQGVARFSQFDFGTGLFVAVLFPVMSRVLSRGQSALVVRAYDRMRDTILSWTLAFSMLMFAFFALKIGSEASRGVVISFYLFGALGLALWRVFSPLVIAPLAMRFGASARECIIVGDFADGRVDKFAWELRASGHPAPTVFRFQPHCPEMQWSDELNRLADLVTAAAHHRGPGEVYICAGSIPGERLAEVGRRLTLLPRAIYVVPDAQTASLVRCKPSRIGDYVALEARREPLGCGQRIIKRGMDILISGIALGVLAPLLLLTAAAIRLESGGPVLFRQTRNGYRGRPFKILKFRSMYVQEDGPVIRQVARGDARITRVGRILRKLSIDELPQLVNILRGDMSLVGPRPHALAHDDFYSRSIENYEIRQHVKPGLTGWAQVNGLRGETATLDAMNKRIEFDLWYAVNASVLLDVEILVRTAIEVVRQRNAY